MVSICNGEVHYRFAILSSKLIFKHPSLAIDSYNNDKFGLAPLNSTSTDQSCPEHQSLFVSKNYPTRVRAPILKIHTKKWSL